jgi:hypothetical protein
VGGAQKLSRQLRLRLGAKLTVSQKSQLAVFGNTPICEAGCALIGLVLAYLLKM